MVIISFSGKAGSGKSESAIQFIEYFDSNKEYEVKAFADYLKKIVSSLTRTELSLLYTHEGKNKLIAIWDFEESEFLVDIDSAINDISKIKKLNEKTKEGISFELTRLLYEKVIESTGPSSKTLYLSNGVLLKNNRRRI